MPDNGIINSNSYISGHTNVLSTLNVEMYNFTATKQNLGGMVYVSNWSITIWERKKKLMASRFYQAGCPCGYCHTPVVYSHPSKLRTFNSCSYVKFTSLENVYVRVIAGTAHIFPCVWFCVLLCCSNWRKTNILFYNLHCNLPTCKKMWGTHFMQAVNLKCLPDNVWLHIFICHNSKYYIVFIFFFFHLCSDYQSVNFNRVSVIYRNINDLQT